MGRTFSLEIYLSAESYISRTVCRRKNKYVYKGDKWDDVVCGLLRRFMMKDQRDIHALVQNIASIGSHTFLLRITSLVWLLELRDQFHILVYVRYYYRMNQSRS